MDIKWLLSELEAAEAEQFESGELEIVCEDGQGREGSICVPVTGIARGALEYIQELEERLHVVPVAAKGGFVPPAFPSVDEAAVRKSIEERAVSPDGEPLKCHACGSCDLKDHTSHEGGHVVHISRCCVACGVTWGPWEYGSWSW